MTDRQPGFLSKLDQRVTALERQRFLLGSVLCAACIAALVAAVVYSSTVKCEMSAEPVGVGR